jgi:restriction-modification enzyme MmeI-like protein
LAALRFLDPACGCGNFLIIAYRELRTLETEVLKELNPRGQRELLDVATLSKVDVSQFYGIEIGEFPARIAEVAMWMMDHIMNVRLSLEFGEAYVRIPLKSSPHIVQRDALEVDWQEILAPAACNYVFGNPPFVGAKYQTDLQRTQVRRIAGLGGSGGTLDYVTAWFLKAAAYVREDQASLGFVATNSITQGEQVAQLWPQLFDRWGLEIAFAHRTFAWGSDARGMAHVHVVILGLVRRDKEPKEKRLFSYGKLNADPVESRHGALSAYLFDATQVVNPHLVVQESRRPLCDVPRLIIGSKPIDGGHYIFDAEGREAFLAREPGAGRFMRPYVGSEEYINGKQRWILALDKAASSELRSMPAVIERIASVKRMRLASSSEPTRQLADTPMRFHVTVIPERPYLVIPKVSSERRDYVPIGWLEPPTVPSDLVFVLEDAELWHFAILTSRMHIAWLRHIGGRLKSDYRYSAGIVYNTFPWPLVGETQKARIGQLAQAVLDARALFAGDSLADLYDSDVMRPELRLAHRSLDLAVDKLYRGQMFGSDRERVEHLFGLYEKLATPLAAFQIPAPRKKRAPK